MCSSSENINRFLLGVTEIPYHHGIRKVDTLLIFAKNINLLGKNYLYYSYYFAIHFASFYYIFSLSGEGKKSPNYTGSQ